MQSEKAWNSRETLLLSALEDGVLVGYADRLLCIGRWRDCPYCGRIGLPQKRMRLLVC